MSTGKPASKGPNVFGALMDFVILVLLVGGAGFGGYWYGTTQRIAPVALVPAGTPGALPASISSTPPSQVGPGAKPLDMGHKVDASSSTAAATTVPPAATSSSTEAASEEPVANKGVRKYWIISSGSDYIGSSITVLVNKSPIDSFFGPGKTYDISSQIKSGDNTISFEPKELGEKYNKHKGDSSAELVLKVVSGPYISENFKQSDVIATYKRSATDEDENKEVKHFSK